VAHAHNQIGQVGTRGEIDVDAVRFRQGCSVEIVDGTRLFVLSDASTQVVDRPLAARVAALVDGRRTSADIVAALATTAAPMAVFAELERLRRAGHLRTAPAGEEPFAGYLESWGPVTDGFPERAVRSPVHVGVLGPAGVADAVTDAVRRLGCPVTRTDGLPPADADGLAVLVVDDYLAPALRDFNAKRQAAGGAWLLAKPWGREVWVGPRFVPGETGCWECLAERLAANRQVERYVAGKRGLELPPVHACGLLPGADGVVAGLVASEVLAVVAGLPDTVHGTLSGRMRTLNLATLASTEHALVAQPQCPVSGDPVQHARRTADVRLGRPAANFRDDGGFRICPPDETVARLAHHVSPYLGAVSKLESLGTDADGITYSFAAGHNFAMVNDNLDLLRSNMRGQSGGKGRTEIQARASAMCEALERFSGVWDRSVPAVRAAYDELDRRAILPQDVLLFSAAQTAGRAEWNADPRNRLHRIPDPFDVTRPVDWTPARSLTRDEDVLVPAGLVWYGTPDLADHFYAATDSNGSAAGNVVEEAVLQGLCEVYERDAVALWWFNRVQRPAVDLDSFDEPYVDVMRDFYARMDRDVWVLDLSTDLSVPVMAAFSRRDHEVEDLMVGFGAHPDPRMALLRALTELNQFLPFVARRDADGNTVYRTDDPATLEWCRETTVTTDPWVLPSPALPASTRAGLRSDLPESIGDLVRWCVDDLDRAGVETVVVNQSRADVELAVVKVIAPSMRHFWRRTGPGRLYDVPVALGWLDRPTPEAELNPRGVFF
jgi:oxazoline/thiazoline synthase